MAAPYTNTLRNHDGPPARHPRRPLLCHTHRVRPSGSSARCRRCLQWRLAGCWPPALKSLITVLAAARRWDGWRKPAWVLVSRS